MAVSQVGSTTTSYYVTNGANGASASSKTVTSSSTTVSSTTTRSGSASTTSSATAVSSTTAISRTTKGSGSASTTSSTTAISSTTSYASATAKTTCSTTVTYSGSSSTAKVSSTTSSIINKQGALNVIIDFLNELTNNMIMMPFSTGLKMLVDKISEMQESGIGLNKETQIEEYKLDYKREINGIGLKNDGTIIMGNNATLDDAFTIVLLDKWEKQGVEQSKILEFIDKYTEKKKANGEETVIVKGKTIEYYSEFEDITKKLMSEMIKNEYENTIFHTDEGMIGINEIPLYWTKFLMEFKENVGNNGIWDLKQKEEWNKSSLYYFDGVLVDKDAPGNIMYGYLGKAYGIPDDILYMAAGYAQLSAGTSKNEFVFSYFDDPIDQNNIKLGIELYNRIHK